MRLTFKIGRNCFASVVIAVLVVASLEIAVDAQTVPASPTTASETVQPEKPTKVAPVEEENDAVVVEDTKGEKVALVTQKTIQAPEEKPETPVKTVAKKVIKKAPTVGKEDEIVEVVEPTNKENYETDAFYEYEYEYATDPEVGTFLGYRKPIRRRGRRTYQIQENTDTLQELNNLHFRLPAD